MSTLFVGDTTHIPFMNTSGTGMCVLQTTDEVDIGEHYNSTLEQRQCFVLTVLTLPQTAPERMSNVGHSRAAIGQSEGRCPLTCTGHPPCRTPPSLQTLFEFRFPDNPIPTASVTISVPPLAVLQLGVFSYNRHQPDLVHFFSGSLIPITGNSFCSETRCAIDQCIFP